MATTPPNKKLRLVSELYDSDSSDSSSAENESNIDEYFIDSENDIANDVNPNDEKTYEIRQVQRRVAKKYAMEDISYEARFLPERVKKKTKLIDMTTELKNVFQDILDKAGENYDADDRIRVNIDHAGLNQPVIVHLQPKSNVTADTILDR